MSATSDRLVMLLIHTVEISFIGRLMLLNLSEKAFIRMQLNTAQLRSYRLFTSTIVSRMLQLFTLQRLETANG